MKLSKFYLILALLIISLSWANNYHGAAIVATSPNSWKGWVVCIDTGLVLNTPNSGIGWTNQSFQTSRYFFDVFFLDTLKGWIGTDHGFIYYTDDGGNTWNLQVMGLAKHAARIQFIDSLYGWAACGGAIIGRTINGGLQWDQLIMSYPPFAVDTVDLYDISFVNSRKGWFCAGRYPELINDTLCFKGGQGFIAYSIDGGDTWQLQKRDSIYDFFGLKFKDSLNGIVVGGNDSTNNGIVMKTQNGGQTWQTVTIPSQTKILRALEWVGNHLWAVGRNGIIIHSSNNGTSWSTQLSYVDTTLFDVDFADTLHGLISGNGRVLYTNNGGNTWTLANIEGIEEPFVNLKLDLRNRKSLSAFPNPFRYQVTLYKPIESMLQIYNISGQIVKTFSSRNSIVTWQGKDSHGRLVPTGIYFATARDNQHISVVPIIYQK